VESHGIAMPRMGAEQSFTVAGAGGKAVSDGWVIAPSSIDAGPWWAMGRWAQRHFSSQLGRMGRLLPLASSSARSVNMVAKEFRSLPVVPILRPSTKKLSVIIDADLHNRVKRMALLNDQTLTELIVSVLEDLVNSDSVSN